MALIKEERNCILITMIGAGLDAGPFHNRLRDEYWDIVQNAVDMVADEMVSTGPKGLEKFYEIQFVFCEVSNTEEAVLDLPERRRPEQCDLIRLEKGRDVDQRAKSAYATADKHMKEAQHQEETSRSREETRLKIQQAIKIMSNQCSKERYSALIPKNSASRSTLNMVTSCPRLNNDIMGITKRPMYRRDGDGVRDNFPGIEEFIQYVFEDDPFGAELSWVKTVIEEAQLKEEHKEEIVKALEVTSRFLNRCLMCNYIMYRTTAASSNVREFFEDVKPEEMSRWLMEDQTTLDEMVDVEERLRVGECQGQYNTKMIVVLLSVIFPAKCITSKADAEATWDWLMNSDVRRTVSVQKKEEGKSIKTATNPFVGLPPRSLRV